MADAGKNAITTNSGDGSTTQFLVGFSFLDITHIQVTVDGSVQSLNSDYEIDTSGAYVNFTIAPGTGTDNIVFTRVTPHSTLFVDFANGATVTDVNLDQAMLQSIYYTEEVEDQI